MNTAPTPAPASSPAIDWSPPTLEERAAYEQTIRALLQEKPLTGRELVEAFRAQHPALLRTYAGRLSSTATLMLRRGQLRCRRGLFYLPDQTEAEEARARAARRKPSAPTWARVYEAAIDKLIDHDELQGRVIRLCRNAPRCGGRQEVIVYLVPPARPAKPGKVAPPASPARLRAFQARVLAEVLASERDLCPACARCAPAAWAPKPAPAAPPAMPAYLRALLERNTLNEDELARHQLRLILEQQSRAGFDAFMVEALAVVRAKQGRGDGVHQQRARLAAWEIFAAHTGASVAGPANRPLRRRRAAKGRA